MPVFDAVLVAVDGAVAEVVFAQGRIGSGCLMLLITVLQISVLLRKAA